MRIYTGSVAYLAQRACKRVKNREELSPSRLRSIYIVRVANGPTGCTNKQIKLKAYQGRVNCPTSSVPVSRTTASPVRQ
jgi:hypothetical protein